MLQFLVSVPTPTPAAAPARPPMTVPPVLPPPWAMLLPSSAPPAVPSNPPMIWLVCFCLLQLSWSCWAAAWDLCSRAAAGEVAATWGQGAAVHEERLSTLMTPLTGPSSRAVLAYYK
jgi:hypothetical protein